MSKTAEVVIHETLKDYICQIKLPNGQTVTVRIPNTETPTYKWVGDLSDSGEPFGLNLVSGGHCT